MTLPPRKAHVKRIYPTDKDGKVISQDIWIDVLRIDNILLDYRGMRENIQNAGLRYYFKWMDDKAKTGAGDEQGERGNKYRTTQSLAIHNPEEPKDQKDNDIKLYLIWKQHIKLPHQYFDVFKDWQGDWDFIHYHNNAPADGSGPDEDPDNPDNALAPKKPAKRKVHKARITHVELPQDLDMSAPVDWEDYQKALQKAVDDGNAEKSIYVDTEILEQFLFNYSDRAHDKPRDEVYSKNYQTKDLVKLIDAGSKERQKVDPNPSDPAGTKNGLGEVPTLYRLDPLQTIVNVQWSVLALAVTFIGTAGGSSTFDDIVGQGREYIVYCDGPYPPTGWIAENYFWMTYAQFFATGSIAPESSGNRGLYWLSGSDKGLHGNPVKGDDWVLHGMPTDVLTRSLPPKYCSTFGYPADGSGGSAPEFEQSLTLTGKLIDTPIGPAWDGLQVTCHARSVYGSFLFSGDAISSPPLLLVTGPDDPGFPWMLACGPVDFGGGPFFVWKDSTWDQASSIPIFELVNGVADLGSRTWDLSGVTITKGDAIWEAYALSASDALNAAGGWLLFRRKMTP